MRNSFTTKGVTTLVSPTAKSYTISCLDMPHDLMTLYKPKMRHSTTHPRNRSAPTAAANRINIIDTASEFILYHYDSNMRHMTINRVAPATMTMNRAA